MNIELAILRTFPTAIYHPAERLVTWYPRGVFDDGAINRILEFIEWEERIANEPFNRYLDLTGLSEIQSTAGHTFQIAQRRRRGYQGDPVKSAIFADTADGFAFARLYEELMEGARISVHAFRTREAAADWLAVPAGLLLPPI